MDGVYEVHRHSREGLPLIFRQDTVTAGSLPGTLHWHEAIELLYCVEGRGELLCNGERIEMLPGGLAVVNSNQLHTITSGSRCRYYCLIADPALLQVLGPQVPSLHPLVRDAAVRQLLESIVLEMTRREPLYQPQVYGLVVQLYVYLLRHHSLAQGGEALPQDGRVVMVKEAMAYIRQNFRAPLTLPDICRHVTFSKYYLCHGFKALTGQTVLEYIQRLRCEHARRLLLGRQCNINESARQSGFQTPSYFTKVYKKHMGELPSEVVRHPAKTAEG